MFVIRTMSSIEMLSTLALASICFMHANAYPSGAPTAACNSMTPEHGASAQPGNGGFAVSIDKASLTNGDTLTVTLTGGTFRGVLIKAITRSNGNVAGTWGNLPSPDFQHLSCGTPKGAVTHSNGNDKSSPVSFSWTPPASQAMVSYTIYVTVVVKKIAFYVKIPSQTITYAPTTATTAEPSTTATTLPTTANTTTTKTTTSTWTTTATTVTSTNISMPLHANMTTASMPSVQTMMKGVSTSASNVTSMQHLNTRQTTSGFSACWISAGVLWLIALSTFINAI